MVWPIALDERDDSRACCENNDVGLEYLFSEPDLRRGPSGYTQCAAIVDLYQLSQKPLRLSS